MTLINVNFRLKPPAPTPTCECRGCRKLLSEVKGLFKDALAESPHWDTWVRTTEGQDAIARQSQEIANNMVESIETPLHSTGVKIARDMVRESKKGVKKLNRQNPEKKADNWLAVLGYFFDEYLIHPTTNNKLSRILVKNIPQNDNNIPR